MAKFIPNENTWIGFQTALVGELDAPKVADVTGAVDITALVTGLTASATGQAVPTPAFDSLFETSVPGTSTSTFSIDCYRDDEDDVAWDLLPRATKGFFIISRYGLIPDTAGDKCEVWPVVVLSRSMANMASNTVSTFTVTCSVPREPAEDAVVVT